MIATSVHRIDASGASLPFPDGRLEAVLREGEALHCAFRPAMQGDYFGYLSRMAAEGAGLLQLFDEGEVRAVAVWRSFLTAYCGRRFEIDDLVTDEAYRSRAMAGRCSPRSKPRPAPSNAMP